MTLTVPCAGPTVVVHDPGIAEYDFGPTHPMAPLRVELTMRLAESLGVLGGSAGRPVEVVPGRAATEDQLATVHDPAFIEAVMRAGATMAPDEEFGLGTADDPVFREIHHASAHIAGSSIEACRRVWQGQALHAVNVMGGLHHAMPGRASGFCVYNDVAVGIRWLLDHGCERVAYLDLDAHHGDGVQTVFWNDPRVLTVSLHETGETLFPGTGYASETGGPDAEGTAVNVALPPSTGDAGWLRAFHAVVPELVRAFRPTILVTQQGCDSHADDPLTHLELSVDGQREAYLQVHALAHELTGGKWVAFGGGGYSIAAVVPRAWTHLIAIAAGQPLDSATPVPSEWRELVRATVPVERLFGRELPSAMTDGKAPEHRDWRSGYDPATWLDRQINATRRASFPLFGLDPEP